MLTITPTLTEYRYGDDSAPDLEFTASGNTGTVNWVTTSGYLDYPTGLTNRLSPLNQSEIIIVTAEDDSDTVTVQVQIWATFPVQPKWEVESDFTPPIASWPMVYEKREYEEWWRVLQFYNYHGPADVEMSQAEDGSVRLRILRGKAFYIVDISTGIIAKGYFDSALRQKFIGAVWVDYSFQFKSYEFEVPGVPLVGPWAGEDLSGLPGIFFSDDLFKSASTLVSSILSTLAANEYVSSIALICHIPYVGSGLTSITASVGSSTSGNGAYYVPPVDITVAGTYRITGLARDDSNADIVVTINADSEFGDGSATILTAGWIEIQVETEVIG